MPYVPANFENTYIVKSGDTLWSISRKFGLTVNELKDLNNLTSNSLSIGQVLKIKEVSNNNTSTGNTYVVQSGDTLYGIANRFGLTVDELKRINNLTSNLLSIGQVLKISLDNQNNNEGVQYYIVKSGDNLYKIANLYGITVNELKAANNLTSNLLSIGQNLIIPSNNSTSNYEVYTVQKGDNLYSIARRYNTTVTAIQSLNNLSTSNLSIGQKLLIP